MSGDPYGERVRQLFAATAHAGTLEPAIRSRVDAQGVSVELAAQVEEGRLAALRFRARGCPHLIAAAEAFCASWEGRDGADLGGFKASELMQTLPVPVEKTGRILVIEDAVHALGHVFRDTESTGN